MVQATTPNLFNRLLQSVGTWYSDEEGAFWNDDDCSSVECQVLSTLMAIFMVILVLIAWFYESFKQKAAFDTMAKIRKEHRQWVREPLSGNANYSPTAANPLDFPSGTWQGYFHKNNQPCLRYSFVLLLTSVDRDPNQGSLVIGKLRGSGDDDDGGYDIDGLLNFGSGRIAFTKKYIRPTGGFHNTYDSVECRGTVQGSIEAGIHGTWIAVTSEFNCKAPFYVWPSHVALVNSCFLPPTLVTENTPLLLQPQVAATSHFYPNRRYKPKHASFLWNKIEGRHKALSQDPLR